MYVYVSVAKLIGGGHRVILGFIIIGTCSCTTLHVLLIIARINERERESALLCSLYNQIAL